MTPAQLRVAAARVRELGIAVEKGERTLLEQRVELGLLLLEVRASVKPNAARLFEGDTGLKSRTLRRCRRLASHALEVVDGDLVARDRAVAYAELYPSCRAAEAAMVVAADPDPFDDSGEGDSPECSTWNRPAGDLPPEPDLDVVYSSRQGASQLAGGAPVGTASPEAVVASHAASAAVSGQTPSMGEQLTLEPLWLEAEQRARSVLAELEQLAELVAPAGGDAVSHVGAAIAELRRLLSGVRGRPA